MTTHWPVEVDLPEASVLADYTGVEEDLKIAADSCDRLVSIWRLPELTACKWKLFRKPPLFAMRAVLPPGSASTHQVSY